MLTISSLFLTLLELFWNQKKGLSPKKTRNDLNFLPFKRNKRKYKGNLGPTRYYFNTRKRGK